MKHYHTNSVTYKRLMEILEDYWLTQPDEAHVRIDLTFVKGNGEVQVKHLYWDNPVISELEGEEF